jgi:hypothetical protein
MTCTFSGGNALDILAPGCNTLTGGIDEAFEDDGTPAVGFGTSQSAALVSAVIAAMRAYSPAIGVAEAELCLTASERPGGGMDVAAAFMDCGLGRIVDAGLANTPLTPAAQPLVPHDATDGTSGRPTDVAGTTAAQDTLLSPTTSWYVPTPRLVVIRRRSRLTVRVTNRPKGAIFEARLVSVRHKTRHVVASRRSVSNSIMFTVTGAGEIAARYVLHGGKTRTSQWVTKAID